MFFSFVRSRYADSYLRSAFAIASSHSHNRQERKRAPDKAPSSITQTSFAATSAIQQHARCTDAQQQQGRWQWYLNNQVLTVVRVIRVINQHSQVVGMRAGTIEARQPAGRQRVRAGCAAQAESASRQRRAANVFECQLPQFM